MLKLLTRRRDTLDQLGLTLTDLLSHLLLIGASGSGKTSVLKLLMTDILRRGHAARSPIGLVWSCVKNDEAANAIRVIQDGGAADRLLHFIPGAGLTFNFLAWEIFRPGGSFASAAALCQRMNSIVTRASGEKQEAFWANIFFKFLQYSITVAALARGRRITIEDVYRLATSSPASAEQVASATFRQNSYCFELLAQAERNITNDAERRLYRQAATFLLSEAIQIGSKARGAALSQLSAIMSPFLLDPFYQTVCVEHSTFSPEQPLAGSCVVLDFPVLVHRDAGLLFQALVNTLVTEAALRRSDPTHTTLLVRDELHLLLAEPEFEAMAQSVARSHRLGFISACQNLPLLQSALGGAALAEQHLHAIIANYSAKVILANSCKITNGYFSEAWGEHREEFVTVSESKAEEELDLLNMLFGNDRLLFSASQQLVSRCPVEHFLALRRGGTANGLLVDAFYTQAGRTFGPARSPFAFVTFKQR